MHSVKESPIVQRVSTADNEVAVTDENIAVCVRMRPMNEREKL
uniref:Kinesin motor domain-containing protein n=1 Tax=Peronospora matthiolae TaxID=2874970 RepID=A0AAV1VN19_9STRA